VAFTQQDSAEDHDAEDEDDEDDDDEEDHPDKIQAAVTTDANKVEPKIATEDVTAQKVQNKTHTEKDSTKVTAKKISPATMDTTEKKNIEKVPEITKMLKTKKEHTVLHEGAAAVEEKAVVKVAQATDPTTTVTTTTMMANPMARGPPPIKTPVATAPKPEHQWKKCRNGPVDCGLLHDNMSLMWGKFKDRVDELVKEMEMNQAAHSEYMANLNGQTEVIRIAKARFMMMLSEAVSNTNGYQSEAADKETRKVQLELEYKKKMHSCKTALSEILFTNICAVRKVRNEVLAESTVISVEDITDCDFSDWKPDDCSKDCDDECPKADPYACGGWQKLKRDIIEPANVHGVACPALVRKKKCNQFKCAVDCVMSVWSGFSKCTKECEGGVQGRNRAIVAKPRDGGSACDNVQESQPCTLAPATATARWPNGPSGILAPWLAVVDCRSASATSSFQSVAKASAPRTPLQNVGTSRLAIPTTASGTRSASPARISSSRSMVVGH